VPLAISANHIQDVVQVTLAAVKTVLGCSSVASRVASSRGTRGLQYDLPDFQAGKCAMCASFTPMPVSKAPARARQYVEWSILIWALKMVSPLDVKRS
jgi:hypothetical protein